MSNPQQTTDPATWQRLCEAFTSDPELWQVVQLALAEPAAYLERFRERQSDRSIVTAEAVSPWIALVDWLYEHDRLIELDWKNTSVDVAENLSLLPTLYDLDVAPIEIEQVHLSFAVPRANALLAPRFLTLLYLDIDSDSYPLALVSTEAAPRIRQLAASLGQVARPLDDSDTADPVKYGERGYTAPLAVAAPVGPPAASFGRRTLAFLIDFVLFYGFALGGGWLGTVVTGSNSSDLIPVVLLVVFGGYIVGLIAAIALRGRSVGLWALGLRLRRMDDGKAPGLLSSLGRAALTACFIFWPWAIIAFITTLVDQSGRGLLDKATGTIMTSTRTTAI
jgi:uncharacterized RDD family membrane protein YckC